MKYLLAGDGVFLTIQGEGNNAGTPAIFIRLAGCSVGCENCDTDYLVKEKIDEKEILVRAVELKSRTKSRKVWLTGGEPFDQNIEPLIKRLKANGFFVDIATSGHKFIPDSIKLFHGCGIFVSPHDPKKWKEFCGTEVNIVPGLNGFWLSDFMEVLDSRSHGFRSKRVTPLFGCRESLEQSINFVYKNPDWKLGFQAHKQWGLK